MMPNKAQQRIIIVQPVVPSYRKAFFSTIADSLGDRFSVHASDLDMGVLTEKTPRESWSYALGPMKRLFAGAEWQVGALRIPLARGDIVIISGAPRCLSNLALLLRARLCGAKTIWWGQLWSATSRKYRFILRLALMRLAHAILFYTDAEVATYRSRYGRNDRRPVGALNNGIDVKPIQALRAPYDPAKRGAAILFLGRLTQKAEIALLVRAMAQECLSSAILHIIGDGPETASLQDWARSHGLGARVIWHGGTTDEAAIAKVANQAALFCYPGGVGLSLVHAMAYGLPAVVHDDPTTHMPEIAAFEAGVTGLTFAKGKVDALAESLATLLGSPEIRTRMSIASVLRAETTYNTDSMAQRLIEFIEEVDAKP